MSVQSFVINDKVLSNVEKRLRLKPEVFSLSSDPLFAGLCTCLGFVYEFNSKKLNRMSELLGVDLNEGAENPWQAEVVSVDNNLGVLIKRKDGAEILPRDVMLADFIHPESLDENKKLSRIILIPDQIAQKMFLRGVELVIVRDWLLSVLFCEEKEAVNYLIGNLWEIKNQGAVEYAKTLANKQMAFSGTHDFVDHILLFSAQGFSKGERFFSQAVETFNLLKEQELNWQQLVQIYYVGLLLDDLAQPRWYGSSVHGKEVLRTLKLITNKKPDIFYEEGLLPKELDLQMESVRRSAIAEIERLAGEKTVHLR